MQNDEVKDEIFLDDLQELANFFGDSNEIEVDSNLFFQLMVINCPKKLV